MQTIGAFEAKTHFSALLKEVENGNQVIITKHGHPVAKLVPATVSDQVDVRRAIQRIKELGQKHKGSLDWKKLRDEGRR